MGLSVETDAGIVAYSYDSAEGPTMIIAAPEKAGRVKITIDRNVFTSPGDPKTGQVCRMDDSRAEVAGDTQEFDLDKYEVLTWLA